MKKVLVVICLMLGTQSAIADISLTDKSSTLRYLARNASLPHMLKAIQSAVPLTPEQKALLRAANEAKRAAKRERHRHSGGASILSLHPAPNATGSISLIDAGGLKYFINTNITFSTSSSASGAASEASYTVAINASTSAGGVVASALSDMFDGYEAICVSLTNATGPCATGNPAYTFFNQTGGPAAVDATVPAIPTCTNRQYVFPAKTIGPLSVSRKVFVPTNDQFIRWADLFTNTSGAPVTFTMITGNNLGSDSNTRIVTSSSGDAVAQPSDLWVTTFQNYSAPTSSDPRIGHILQGAGAPTPVSNISFADGDDNPFWVYSITLAPGQTKIILNYATGLGTKAAAATQAAAIAAFGANEQQCLSNTELSQVTNFAVSADLSITKTSSPPASVNAGQPITYTINVSNAGPAAASSVSVTDPLPAGTSFVSATGTGWTCLQAAGTVTCTIASLPVGAANPITIIANAPVTGGPLTNTATVSSTTSDSNPANNSSTTGPLAVVPVADLSIAKTASPTPNVNAGQPVTYTINVSNAGPSPATAVSVSDPLPPGMTFVSASGTGWTCGQAAGTVTCTIASLPAGAANPITIVTNAPATSGPLANTATVSSTTTDSNPANNTSTANVTVIAAADLSIVKTANAPGAFGNIPFSFNLAVSNAGPASASNVSVTDTLPAGAAFVSAAGTGWACGNVANVVTCTRLALAVGAAPPITLTITPGPVSTPGTLTNTASVSATSTDSSPASNSSTASVPLLPGGSIPTLSTWMLVLLGVALGMAGLVKR